MKKFKWFKLKAFAIAVSCLSITAFSYCNYAPTAIAVSENAAGDINGDGDFTVADAVVMQKWLVGSVEIADLKKADLNCDGKADVFDFCIMREMLAEKAVLKSNISRDELIEIAKKGDEITWKDLEGYSSENIDPESNTFEFPINLYDEGDEMVENVVLRVTGGEAAGKPESIIIIQTDTEYFTDIRSDSFKEVIDIYENGFWHEPEINEETNKKARWIGEYYLNELKNGNCTIDSTIYSNTITDGEVSEYWDNDAFGYLKFVDEHTALIGTNKGLLDAYGYLITDGTVKLENGEYSVPGEGYDGDIVWIERVDGNLCYFEAGT